MTIAHSIAAALQAAASRQHDLLISDLGLPDGNGADLVAQLRRDQPIPAIAISGYGMQDDIDNSKSAGFDVHLTKPITIETLFDEIERLSARMIPRPA